METILGIPLGAILAASAVGCGLAALLLGLAAIRKPHLARLAWRNPRRRPGQALLITLGLTLSTVIVSTAFNTGDAVSHTVRSLVASGLGRADEVVLALPRDQRRSPAEYVAALLNGSLLAGLGGYFEEDRATRLAESVAGDRRIAGLTAAISEQPTVVNLDAQSVRGQLTLLALPSDYPTVFGVPRTTDGELIRLAELEPDEVLVTSDAAAQLEAGPGTRLELRTRSTAVPFTVRAVVQNGDPAGSQPTILAQLPAYQRAGGRVGRVNQVLVANAGDRTSSVLLSGEVARLLRVHLADRDAADRLFRIMRSEAFRAQLSAITSSTDGRERERLDALAQSLAADAPSDLFVSLVSDPLLERRLAQAAVRAGGAGPGSGGFPELSGLRVVEVKQAAQDQADRWGGALTSTFLIMGLFSLASGALVVFLIFSTLAAERRVELGVLRALGTGRGDLIAGFVLEGALYALVGSLAGLAIGLVVAVGIVALGNASLEQYGVRLEPRIEPRSLAVAYSLGLLLTILSICYSAWRVSRLSPVAAIRDLPEPSPTRPRRRDRAAAPLLALSGVALLALGRASAIPPAHAAGVTIAITGLALLIRALLARVGVPSRRAERVAFSAAGLALLAFWLVPGEWSLSSDARPGPRALDLFFLGGLGMVLGAVWLTIFNLGAIAGPLVTLLRGAPRTALAARAAVANPLHHRPRTGLTVAMFSLVILSMVVAAVLLTATHRAYSDPEALAGGFDLRIELPGATSPADLRVLLADTPTVRMEDFIADGSVATRPAQLVEPGLRATRWRSANLHQVDAGFAAGLRTPLAARSPRFSSDGEVWQAVLAAPGYAVAAGPEGQSSTLPPSPSLPDLGALLPGSPRFRERTVWVRDERAGRSEPLTVLGVLDSRLSFPAGLYTSAATLGESGSPPAARAVHYLKARPGADPRQLAVGLNLALSERGFRAVAVGEEIRQIQSVRDLLNQLLQGFFAVGLLAGLAALGLISTRAVVERRQQIGVLRAIGFRRGMVRLSFLIETSLIATLGIGLGIVLGLALSHRVVQHLSRQFPEILFGVPWPQIGIIAGGSYLAALAMTAVPIWQIGRVEPARAIRHE